MRPRSLDLFVSPDILLAINDEGETMSDLYEKLVEDVNRVVESCYVACNYAHIQDTDGPETADRLRVRYLGKKGKLTGVLRNMGKLNEQERKLIAAHANDARRDIDHMLTQIT